MALEPVEGRVLIRWEADTSQYRRELSELAATERKEKTERDKAMKDVGKQFDKLGDAVHRTAKEAEELKKKWDVKPINEFSKQAGDAMEKFGKKIGGIGGDLGKMAANFGIGMLGGAVFSIVDQLFAPAPQTIEDLEKMVEMGEQMGDAWANATEKAREQLELKKEWERQNQLMEEAAERVMRIREQYSDRFALQEYEKTIKAIEDAHSSGYLTQEKYNDALRDADDAFAKATTGAGTFEKKIHDIQQSIGNALNDKAVGGMAVMMMVASGQVKDPKLIKELMTKYMGYKEPKRGPRVQTIDTGDPLLNSAEYAWDVAAHRQWLTQQMADERFQNRLGRRDSELEGQLRLSRTPTDMSDEFMSSMRLAGSEAKESWLSRVVGPIEEFDAYQTAFATIQGSMTAAYDAIVEGNMSAGQAVSAFLKQAIKGFGQQMLVRALQETAEGFASLAFGPLGGASASMHFKAAALFGAGAAVAGAIAGNIGTGSGASTGGATAAPTFSGNVGAGGGNNYWLTIGDINGDDSPRVRTQKLKRNLALAGIPDGSGPDAVRFG